MQALSGEEDLTASPRCRALSSPLMGVDLGDHKSEALILFCSIFLSCLRRLNSFPGAVPHNIQIVLTASSLVEHGRCNVEEWRGAGVIISLCFTPRVRRMTNSPPHTQDLCLHNERKQHIVTHVCPIVPEF